MIRPTEVRAEEARRKAKDMFARDRAKEVEIVKEREKAFANQTQKTARLRALRLAREANDRAAAAAAVPDEKPVKKKSTRQKSVKTEAL
jgi:hypothetical protein